VLHNLPVGRDSSDGKATRNGLDGPGIESWWGKIFHTRPDRLSGPPSLLYNWYRVFSGGKAAGAWYWPLTPHLVPKLKESKAITLLPLWAFVTCSRADFYLKLLHKISISGEMLKEALEICLTSWRVGIDALYHEMGPLCYVGLPVEDLHNTELFSAGVRNPEPQDARITKFCTKVPITRRVR